MNPCPQPVHRHPGADPRRLRRRQAAHRHCEGQVPPGGPSEVDQGGAFLRVCQRGKFTENFSESILVVFGVRESIQFPTFRHLM